MDLSPITYYLREVGNGVQQRLGIILFKPKCPEREITRFIDYCEANGIKIWKRKIVLLSRESVIALYPKIFADSENDIRYGVDWKNQTIEYLTSSQCTCFFVEGEAITQKLVHFKNTLRDMHGKITHPVSMMWPDDFFERVVKNLVHVIDENELQNGIWLLFER